MKNLFIYFCIPIFGLLSTSTLAQTTFTGLVSDAWLDAGNWDNGLPASGNDATIPAGLSVVFPEWYQGTITFDINNYGNITNYGIIYMSWPFRNYGTIINHGEFDNELSLSNYGYIENYGDFDNIGYGSIVNDGYITNYGTIFNNETLTNNGVIYNHGEITNYGTINNNETIFDCLPSGYTGPFGSVYFGDPPQDTICGSPEVCDGVDNDLDGAIDEGCGCTDHVACNYNTSATLDDGSCTYPGCTNALACNYTASAACDDGSCTYPGCTDQTACNYDPNAGCDSGTCAPNPSPCNDECINADGSGTDFTSYYAPSNWSQDFGIGNGTILHETGSLCISGSYNGVGQNNTDATIVVNMAGTFTFTWNYATQDENPSFDPAYYINGSPIQLSDNSGQNLQNGIVSFTAYAGDIIGFSINSADSEFGEGRLLITNFTYPTPNEICGCTAPSACNFDPTATVDDGNCIYPGCTDQTACNYDPNAGCDDGNCNYPGCMNALACNYDPSAACDDGSCTFPGCTDQTACNYDPNAGCDSGTCVTNLSSCIDECINADGYGSDFTSYYAPSNWSQDFGVGDGTILHQTGSLHISGSNNEVGPSNTEVAIVVNTSGTFTFAWDYLTLDPDGPSLDPAYFINGSPIQLSDDLGQNLQNGIVSFIANAGDIIGFSINSADSYYGEGRLLITNFTYPTPNEICGCTAPSACNFDPTATVDDGNCTYPGCTDQTACNYDPNAGCDDSSCTYPGCTIAFACNYDPSAACDDGSCTYPGCTDQSACNYDPNAGCDSGSCAANPSPCGDECINTAGDGIDFTSYYAPSNWSQYFGTGDGSIDHNTGSLLITGANIGGGYGLTSIKIDLNKSGTYSFAWDYFLGSDNLPLYDAATYGINGLEIQLTDNFGSNVQSGLVSFTAIAGDFLEIFIFASSGYNGAANLLITNFTYAPEICGCMIPSACNFDPAATVDDGNCTYPGCADSGACNYVLNAGCDDGSCTYPGCTDQTACNYNPNAACDDLSCNYPGCTTTLACNYNPSAGCDDGSCEYTSCAGCMAITACNYNPVATIEDGSCEYSSCSGCTYASAVNYDSNAILDDGSCTFDQGGPNDSCSNDMNADGTVNAADLLIFLSAFGTSCE